MSKWEIRSLPAEEAEVRAKEDRAVEGYGVVFNSWSRDLGGFREMIKPEAINGVIERSDVFALMNHSFEKGVLARSTQGKGSMKLAPDGKGVKYSFMAPKYDLGNELLEGVERGDIRASSFSFTVVPGGDKFEKGEDGIWERTITQFDQLYDMSPVYSPAYTETTVAKRSIQELEAVEKSEPIEAKPPDSVELPDEPIEEYQRKVVSDVELRYRQYKQELELKNLQK
jgi:HK97 family phage prohead protease